MTVLADFQTIIGDKKFQEVVVKDGFQQLGEIFEAGGRISGDKETGIGAAFLIFSVRDLVLPTDVFVNRQGPVGTIQPAQGEWSTQVIAMAGSRLLDSSQNRIQVLDVRERFLIKDLICFYHQDSD